MITGYCFIAVVISGLILEFKYAQIWAKNILKSLTVGNEQISHRFFVFLKFNAKETWYAFVADICRWSYQEWFYPCHDHFLTGLGNYCLFGKPLNFSFVMIRLQKCCTRHVIININQLKLYCCGPHVA